MVMILPDMLFLFRKNRFDGINAYDPPSMPYGNDSSGIMTFTTMMSSIDQFISWIGFHLTVYGSFACARTRDFV